MDKTLSQLPLPNFKVENNLQVLKEVGEEKENTAIPKPRASAMSNFGVESNKTIENYTNSIVRGQEALLGEEGKALFGHIGKLGEYVNVYQDPKAPIMFPQAEDAIKSLNFASASADQSVKDSVIEYYDTVVRLISGDIDADEYYNKMPSLIEKVKDFTLNETDWETLRDSILRVQRYIIHYMWEDMQKISRAMDDGFKEYQRQLNEWIDAANTYYTDEEFIPGGALILDHFGRGAGKISRDEYQLQQNMRYLVDGMCTQIAASKPSFHGELIDGKLHERDQYPTNKQMVWIESIEEVL